MAGCNKPRGLPCSHTILKCPNCLGEHSAVSKDCANKRKAMADAREARVNAGPLDNEIREWKEWEGDNPDYAIEETKENKEREKEETGKGKGKGKEKEKEKGIGGGMESSVHAPMPDRPAMTTQQFAEIVAEEAFEDTQMNDIPSTEVTTPTPSSC